MKPQIVSDYYYEFNHYKVIITYKHIRNIIYRYDKEENTFKISAPILTSQKRIYKYLDKFAPNLIKRAGKQVNPIQGNLVYVFGNLIPIELGKKNQYLKEKIILKKREDLNKVLEKLLKEYLSNRVIEYEKIMHAPHYKISVRNMRTRYGSNTYSKKHLSFALTLVHYAYPIIDSIIIHELAHDKHHHHQSSFYESVLKYCPNYKALNKALKNKDFSYNCINV